ncbi:hypothetical protein ACLMJK_002015 [Lecanora helva]
MYKPEEYLDIPRTDLLSWTFGNTSYDQDKPIYVDAHNESTRISHRQAKSLVKRLIGGLHARGIRPGDSVCVHAFNNVYYSLAWLAIIGAGGRFVGSNPSYTKFELNHLFSITSTKLVLVEPGLLENVVHAAQECSIKHSKVFIWDAHGEDVPQGFESWNALLKSEERDWIHFDDPNQSETTTAALMSTSGTTGLPKAATVSHRAQIAQNILISHSEDSKPYEINRMLCLPLFHAFAGPISHMSPLRDGHTTYIMKRYDQSQFLEYTKRYQITETLIVTPIVQGLLTLPQSKLESLDSLRFVGAAGAPLDRAHQHELNQRLHPDAIFSQIWGLTEYGWITTFKYPEKDAGSVGRLMPNTEAMIVDKDGRELTNGAARGEILIRGPALMGVYLDAPEATAKTVGNGWLHTGDVGYEEGGKWYIVDRAKELIKVRGWQVSPTEIETCLMRHPLILDAAVIGVGYPDVQVELPRAYIVVDRKSDSSSKPLSDKDIHDHVGNHLAKYKSLTGGIRRIDSIPKSAAGKILKRELRKAAAKEATEVESVKHVEQPIPVDKHYFEHVDHVEAGRHAGNGVMKENGHKTVNGHGHSNGIKAETNEVNGNKKRKYETSTGETNHTTSHKRNKSYPNGLEANREIHKYRTRRSSRVHGKVS